MYKFPWQQSTADIAFALLHSYVVPYKKKGNQTGVLKRQAAISGPNNLLFSPTHVLFINDINPYDGVDVTSTSLMISDDFT